MLLICSGRSLTVRYKKYSPVAPVIALGNHIPTAGGMVPVLPKTVPADKSK
jgi:hypothetical protein